MTMLIADIRIEEELKERRKACGADQFDEVWERVYVMTPMAGDEHQRIISRLTFILEAALGVTNLADVRPGVNLALASDDWEIDYRVPDLVVFLAGGGAKNCDTHWTGPADFIIEVTSPNDRTYEKIPFYSRLGAHELLIIDRQSWTIELYRSSAGKLERIGESSAGQCEVPLRSAIVPLSFRLLAGSARPQIEVKHVSSGERWVV